MSGIVEYDPVFGTTGRVDVEIPVKTPSDRPWRLWFVHDSTVEEVAFEIGNQYTLQGEARSQAILDDRPAPTPLTDAVANMRVLEAIVRASQEGRWVLSEDCARNAAGGRKAAGAGFGRVASARAPGEVL